MNNSEPPTKAATLGWALLACVALILILMLGVMHTRFRGSSGPPRYSAGGQDSLTTAVPEEATPSAEDGTGETAASAGGDAIPDVAASLAAAPPPLPVQSQESGSETTGSGSVPPPPTADASQPAPPSTSPPLATPSPITPPPSPGPWTSALDAAGEPPSFQDVCFDDFDPERSLPLPPDLEDWFARVPGEGLELKTVRTRPGETARFEGLMRLKMPWNPAAALRLNLTDFDRLQIHLFAGESGTTLAYYEREHPRWVAYLTSRQAGQPRPQTWVAAATDQARTRRTGVREGGALALRCQDGEAVLSHGDIVLLRAPLAAVPEEVYFEGKATFYGIAAVRSAAPPAEPPPDAASFSTERPGDLAWSEQLPEGSRLARHEDGSLELIASGTQQPGWVTAPLDLPGVCEVVLQLDGATEGTGVFLGFGERRPPHALRFLKDKGSGQACVLVRDFDARETGFPAVGEAFVPFAPDKPWVRLLFACGSLHGWTSADGLHWVSCDKYGGDVAEPATHVGLMHQGGLGEARIRLRSLEVRPLPEFNGLAEPELVRQAIPPQPGSYQEWLVWTTERQPPGVDASRWRRASALSTLARGCPRQLGTALIELLLDDARASGLPPDRQLSLLREAARMLTVRDDYTQREALLNRYHQLGMEAFQQTGARPFSLIREQLLSVPLGSHDDLRVAREATIQAEILQLTHEDRWQELFAFCRELRFFRQAEVVPLLDWAEATALRHLPQGAGGRRLVGRKQDWAPPWMEELSRPSYNFLAELQAMLDSGAWQDAGRFLTALDTSLLTGLATHVRDARRHLSLPTAIQETLGDWPQLQAVIQQQYSDLAELRIRSAIERGDAAALQLATIQFAGTEAAARAHHWLGDRALAAGWFTTALAEYRRGAATADPAMQNELVQRQRLAAAMQGQRLEGPAEGEVVLGQYRLSAAEFERLIEEMAGSRGEPAIAMDAAPVVVPPPSGYRIQRRGRLDGPLGKNPGEPVSPQGGRLGSDWVGRQLATTVFEDTLYISNRFHVSAYQASDGGRRWQFAPDGGTPLRSRDWGLIAMRPLLARQSVFARLLYEPGPQLVCLDRGSGQSRWSAELAANQAVVSDPLMVQGQLAAFTVQRQEQGANLLRLSLFDSDTGRRQTEHDLLRLNDVWWRRRCCEVILVDDTLVAVISGVTFCCDMWGHLRWVRQQTVLPPDEAPSWTAQSFQRPIRRGDQLFVTQPGAQAVECLETSSGRAVWTRLLPGIRRMIGFSADRLILELDDTLTALDTASGQTVWQRPAAGILQAAACDAEWVLFGQSAGSPREARREGCRLVWLHAASGQIAGSAPLTELNAPGLALGPLICQPGSLWTFFVAGKDEATPEWLELIPEGEAEPSEEHAGEPDVWTRFLSAELVQLVRRRFPGWEVISGELDKKGPLEPERNGQTNVLLVPARHGQPVAFARQVAVPSSGQPRLRLTWGQREPRDWVLEVRFSGQVLHREEISGRSSREPWQTSEIDLKPAAGRPGQLVIEARFRGGGESVDLFWREIEIVF